MTSTEKLRSFCRPSWDENLSANVVTRLWRRDHTLWKPSPEEISNRLGWLDLPQQMRARLDDLKALSRQTREEGFRHVVVLGMGGSSLCSEVLRQCFPPSNGFPQLYVLDSTHPDAVASLAKQADPARTLFIVGSKSGGTLEVMSFYRHFRKLVEATVPAAGERFIAITDPGTSLEKLAREEGFRQTLSNPPDVGGRYSALSLFGLAPAALRGLDCDALLTRAQEMSRACGVTMPMEENPGAWLGMLMGCMAIGGRDKLTFLTSPGLESFGLWVEQLIAESTGKEGKGILPVVGEPFAPASAYGDDRFFVALRSAAADNAELDRHLAQLEAVGQPTFVCELRDADGLAAEFFRWEFATAIAGACLDVNPFDQPNVQESKTRTKQALAEFERTRQKPTLRSEGSFGGILQAAEAGDFVCLMAYAEQTAELDAALEELRRQCLLRRRLPTTLGYGPRFLHSTGQYHKGGPNKGIFIQLTCDGREDLAVPGTAYTFGTLCAAQAAGDYEALRSAGRRCMRVHAENADALRDCIARAAAGI